MKIGIACGGTGGHVFPGLAVGRRLRDRGHEVVLWLSGRGVERESLEGWNGAVVCVKASGFSSGFSFRWIYTAIDLILARNRCRQEMRVNKPDVLLAMGSYSSVGPVLAARSLGVPVVLHEANAIPGRAISMLTRYASVVAVGFEQARDKINHNRIVVTGFPVRRLNESAFEHGAIRNGVFTVLVMGGSQGAHRVNHVACGAMCKLQDMGVSFQVVHLAGAKDESEVRKRYEESGVSCLVFGFLSDMGKAYAIADLAVSRAGAASCAELAVNGVPAVLIPLPSARKDHQSANAFAMRAAGGMDVINESDLTEERLAGYVEECCSSRDKIQIMKKSLASIAVPDADVKLADLVEEEGMRADT